MAEPFLIRARGFSDRFSKSPARAIQTFVQNRLSESRYQTGRNALLREGAPDVPMLEDGDSPADEQLESALESLAWHESADRTAPFQAGRIVEKFFTRDDRLHKLGDCAKRVAQRYPESVLLVYLQSVSLALSGQSVAAQKVLSDALAMIWDQIRSAIDIGLLKPKLIFLNKVWSVLDKIARDKMSWIEGAEPENGGYLSLDYIVRSDISPEEYFDLTIALLRAEPLLQGRHEREYLAECASLFEKCDTFSDRLKVVEAMCKQGMRRTSTYHAPYAQTRSYFQRLQSEWEEQIRVLSERWSSMDKSPVALVREGRRYYSLARKLSIDIDFDSEIELLTEMVSERWGRTARFAFSMLLVEHDLDRFRLLSRQFILRNDDAVPRNANDLRDFMNWAQLAQEYDLALSIFPKIRKSLRRDRALSMYIKILQLTGQSREAAIRMHSVQAHMFCRVRTFCPITAWKLLTRAGELDFLADTADIYTAVPQPKSPQGVVFILPRTIEQLRRAPIVVLMELKRMGWAVVPLVQGLLPNEPTGIDEIDQFNGCLSPNGYPRSDFEDKLNEPEEFEYVENEGRLNWMGLDMAHPIWEEAAANRRRYEIDYSCPALRQYLAQPVAWTKLFASVAVKMRDSQKNLGLRFGSLIGFNYRLPDVVFRYFCEKFGDPDEFFSIHAANGYQNYFANFAVSVSTKGIMRNMTRHAETRSGSFPVPSEFAEYFAQNKSRADHILQMVEGVTRVKRSTEGLKALAPDAESALRRVHAWRDEGGKVACAFGKVVCDSGVPFDGGPAHRNMKDWLNHTIECVKNSNTLLLIKPHPHELKEQIACFLNQYFFDLIEEKQLPDNVILCGHRWFDIASLKNFVDLGLIYNGTTSVELGVLGIPSILCSHFAPIDYPVGHVTPRDREDYRRYVRFEQSADVCDDLKQKAACWLYYMGTDRVTLDYRYHARMITNEVIYPSWWFKEDVKRYFLQGDNHVHRLALRATS